MITYHKDTVEIDYYFIRSEEGYFVPLAFGPKEDYIKRRLNCKKYDSWFEAKKALKRVKATGIGSDWKIEHFNCKIKKDK